jgi:signal transduction histidine kinase
MIGISGRDMMGKSMEELFPPEHAAKFTADDWTVVSKGDVLKLDEELNGRFYTTIKFPITLGDKTLLAGYTIDITDRKLAELQLEKYAEELKELNKTKDRFFSIIAHDLKSPFQGLLGMTQLFAEDIESFSTAELSKMSKALYNRTKSLFRLLKNLLDWAQTQNGKMSFNPVTLNLSEVISQSMGFIMKRCELKEITITKSIPKTQRVYADEAMLNSILSNLLSNAFKFTNRGGEIIIRTKPTENSMVEISIKDNGVGMSTDLINKLFKIEEKVGRLGTEGEESTGLGLLLCKEFAEKHGGRFWLESEENKGSTFFFTIPAGS